MNCQSKKHKFRAPQARANRLGSARSGFRHWWVQRLTGIALVPLSLWFVYCLICLSQGHYHEIRAWVSSPVGAIGLILFLTASGYHSYLGMQVIFEDYMQCYALRLTSRIVLLFLTCAAVITGIFSVLRHAL